MSTDVLPSAVAERMAGGHGRPAMQLRSVDVRFGLPGRKARPVCAVTGVSLTLRQGRLTALVGESGSGKSALASAIVGLLPPNAEVRGAVLLDAASGGAPVDLLDSTERMLATQIRGRRVGYMPQAPVTHLTPVRTARSQLAETVRAVEPACLDVARRVADLATEVGLHPAVLGRYPHELSGGMAQRVAMAMVLAGDPDVVIADEPTTGLDRPLAERATGALRTLADQGRAVLMVTHDLAAANRVADDIAVMYAGRLLEVGTAEDVLGDPWHDYSAALLSALPERGLEPIPGDPPELSDLPEGCPFHQRVPGDCDGQPILSRAGDRWVACGQGRSRGVLS